MNRMLLHSTRCSVSGPVLAAVLLASIVLVPGCNDSTGVPKFQYRPQTTPENVLLNMQDSYKRREIEPYKALLAPEYTFILQPQDVPDLGTDHYTRDQDITGTTALFTTSEVNDILIALVFGQATLANDATLPADAVRIRANQVQLQVDETAGISWLVTDIQDFYLRPGRPENGESLTNWYLLEWRDIPTTASPRIDSGRGITWGKLKGLYNIAVSLGGTR